MRVVPVLFPCDLGTTARGAYQATGVRGAPDLVLDMFEGEGVRFARPRHVVVELPEAGDPEDAPIKLDGPVAKAVAALAAEVAAVNADGDFPLILGGDQTATLGQVLAAGERANGMGLAVLADAHLDLATPGAPAYGDPALLKDPAHTYDGDVDRMVLAAALRMLPESTALGALMAKSSLRANQTSVLGVRGPMSAQVRQNAKRAGIEVWAMERVELDGESSYRSMLSRHLEMAPIVLSIDASGLDPALMTAVRRPEPDGVDWAFLKRSVEQCAPHVDRLLGLDLSGIDPSLDDVHHTAMQRLVETLAPFVRRLRR